MPPPRGSLTDALFTALRRPPHQLTPEVGADVDCAAADDLQLALYCCYELHYAGFPDVTTEWEWEPSLLALRRQMEVRVEAALRRAVGEFGGGAPGVVDELRRMATNGDGPSLSGWMATHANRWHLEELAMHRSAYQLKEADPHTWAIPRLEGEAKAAMVTIQTGEYGDGEAAQSHAVLFATTMAALGLDPVRNAYLADLPAETLLTNNVISLFGLHRRLRGALVGHLALFEMTSVGPMGRYAETMARLGFGHDARRFYDVHVEADVVHERLATDSLVAGLLRREPELATDVVFGARTLQAVEARFTAHVLREWRNGQSSLRDAPSHRG